MLALIASINHLLDTQRFVVVQGANGAGKTTLLRAIAAKTPPHRHYVSHKNGLKPYLTVRETLTFWARMLGGTLTDVGLDALLDKPIEHLSYGQQRHVCLARLLLAPRPLWILDEPDTGLDQTTFGRVKDWLTVHLNQGGQILLASHNPPDVWPQPHVLFPL